MFRNTQEPKLKTVTFCSNTPKGRKRSLDPSVLGIGGDLTTSIDRGQTVVFCGAGISYNSGLPTVIPFIRYLLEKFDLPEEHKKAILGPQLNDLGMPFEGFMESLIENSDATRLIDMYKAGNPNTNHRLLAKLMKAGKYMTIVTTNFDTAQWKHSCVFAQ